MDRAEHELVSWLLDEHGPALVLYAQQWCDIPEDVVQESLMKLMAERPVPDNVVGWMYRVVRNTAVSASRAVKARSRHEQAAASQRHPWFQNSHDGSDTEFITARLASLPLEQREPIVLRMWSGLSFQQIAELVGVSTSTAHRHYQQGIERLRSMCESTTHTREANK